MIWALYTKWLYALWNTGHNIPFIGYATLQIARMLGRRDIQLPFDLQALQLAMIYLHFQQFHAQALLHRIVIHRDIRCSFPFSQSIVVCKLWQSRFGFNVDWLCPGNVVDDVQYGDVDIVEDGVQTAGSAPASCIVALGLNPWLYVYWMQISCTPSDYQSAKLPNAKQWITRERPGLVCRCHLQTLGLLQHHAPGGLFVRFRHAVAVRITAEQHVSVSHHHF